MEWPPQVGEKLPRAAECWREPVKFARWILAPRGHGSEVACGIKAEVTIKGRTSTVTMSWHYAAPSAAPRLVAAYPST
jgi:hypothetical protein